MSQPNAPISLEADSLVRTGDQDAVSLASGRTYSAVPTAARTYSLPPLANVQDGAQIVVSNKAGGAFDITVNPASGDRINDGPVDTGFVVSPDIGGSTTFWAKKFDGTTAASWFTL